MAIAKPMSPFDVAVQANPDETAIDVNVTPAENPGFEVDDSGDVTVDLSGGEGDDPSNADVPFGANLAEHVEPGVLASLSSELLTDYVNDLNSRSDWEKTYKDGIDLLGLKIEERTEPWDGACGVFHPLILEATIKYQAEAMTETFPASGPVKTQVLGQLTPQKEQQATRVRDDMNYWLTSKIKDYRSEHERMLWAQSLCGSSFKKIYADPVSQLPRAMYVPAEDFVVAYGASDLCTASRFTHVMRKTENDIKKLQVAGFYRDIDIGEPSVEQSALKQKKDKSSQHMPQVNDDRYVLLEMHVELDLEGFEDENEIERPYVVTINKANNEILSIYRNWEEQDKLQQRRMHFVHYPFVPGFGFYGYGWVHLLGNPSKAATSILRQLVDAGTLSNLPGGLKARGLRIKSDDTPIMPGEWRDIDIPGGKISDNVMALPYKEPSATLAALMGAIVDEGRRLAGITDIQVADFKAETPVGTTLAILERTLKVMNAIQARVHAAMREEFDLLVKIIRDNTPPSYDYDVEGGERQIKQADYADNISIMPVSDPNATTMAQRVVQYQAALQLASQAPDLYNRPELHRKMLTVLGIRDADKLLPMQDEIKPSDPVSENMAMLTGKPVRTFLFQDHQAHISTHMALAQDPKILAMIGQSPNAGTVKGAFAAHVTEHLAYAYRSDIEREMGTPLPELGAQLPPEVEANLSALVASAAAKLLRKDLAEMEAQRIVQTQQDPIIQMQQRELDIKEGELMRKVIDDLRTYSQEDVKMVLDYMEKMKTNNANALASGLQVGVDAVHRAADRETEMIKAREANQAKIDAVKAKPKPAGGGGGA